MVLSSLIKKNIIKNISINSYIQTRKSMLRWISCTFRTKRRNCKSQMIFTPLDKSALSRLRQKLNQVDTKLKQKKSRKKYFHFGIDKSMENKGGTQPCQSMQFYQPLKVLFNSMKVYSNFQSK